MWCILISTRIIQFHIHFLIISNSHLFSLLTDLAFLPQILCELRGRRKKIDAMRGQICIFKSGHIGTRPVLGRSAHTHIHTPRHSARGEIHPIFGRSFSPFTTKRELIENTNRTGGKCPRKEDVFRSRVSFRNNLTRKNQSLFEINDQRNDFKNIALRNLNNI